MYVNPNVNKIIIQQQLLKNDIIKAIDSGNKLSVRKLFTENDKYAEEWVNKNILNFYKYNTLVINSKIIDSISKDVLNKLKKANNSAKNKILNNMKIFQNINTKNLTQKEIQRLKIQIINDAKIFTITTKTGRRLKLDYYTRLVATGAWIQTKNAAIIEVMKRQGKDLCKVSSHANSCPICQPLQGKIYSISGNNTIYPKLPFGKYLNVHPNCTHYIIPIK